MTNLDEFDDLLDMLDEPTQPLERLSWLAGNPPPDMPLYRIWDKLGFEQDCRFCGENKWLHIEGEYICDHSNDGVNEYCPLPVYDSRQDGQIGRVEQYG